VVGEAADGDQAVESVAALGPDVVFLDIQMPALSGLDVAARLDPPRPRIVFCTAFDRFAIEAFEQHALDYLLKPVNRERLLHTIDRLRRELEGPRDIEEAARTQARLMPQAAESQSLDWDAICRPARGVGGDYYDILPAAAGRTVLAVADVSGKGLYAGILAAALQARLQAIVASGATDPGVVLTELNRLTAGRMDAHRFATMCLAIHDPAGGTLSFTGAGHHPALLVSADGRVRELESSGAAIGWASEPFRTDTFSVRAGDLLVMFSDGLTEACAPDGVEFGIERVRENVLRHAAGTAADITTAVIADVDAVTGRSPAIDDCTLLVARVR
jgi:serine phosphatase RsbU (regulator of sigma subunit)